MVSFGTGREVVRAGCMTCDLTGIWTVLDQYLAPKGRLVTAVRAAMDRSVRVEGSGIIQNPLAVRHTPEKLALRGALTQDVPGAPVTTPLGDPGLLSAAMLANSSARRRACCPMISSSALSIQIYSMR